jgi:hypothetical protein
MISDKVEKGKVKDPKSIETWRPYWLRLSPGGWPLTLRSAVQRLHQRLGLSLSARVPVNGTSESESFDANCFSPVPLSVFVPRASSP